MEDRAEGELGERMEGMYAERDRNSWSLDHTWILVLIVSIVLRLAFVHFSSYSQYQHDSWNLDSDSGHAVYIHNVATYGLDSLGIDPMSQWSFYNPPLHYWIAAPVFNIVRSVCPSEGSAMEKVQYLTAAFTIASSVLGVAILRKLGLGGRRFSLAASLWCGLPILIPLSGQLSPDALFLLLSLGVIYFSVGWFKDPTPLRAAALGLCLALSVMTKSSGIVNAVYPGVAMLMQIVWHRPRLSWRKAVLHSVIALGIAAVVGGWWHVYALVVHRMPLGYMQKLDLEGDASQYIGSVSLLRRFFDVSLSFATPFLHFDAGIADYNVVVSEVKSSLFDELTTADPWAVSFAYASLLLGLAYVAIAACTMVANTRCAVIARGAVTPERDSAPPVFMHAFALVGFIVSVAAALYLAFSEPFTCSMSFRYIIPSALFAAYFFAEGRGDNADMLARWSLGLALLFFSTMFYIRWMAPCFF